MEIIPLDVWYPTMAAKWQNRRPVPWTDRKAWVHHHSAGGTGANSLAYARSVADFHWEKWKVPGGYNFFIGTDGAVREMCGFDYQGVHAGSHEWNRQGVAVCFQGDFRIQPPSDVMLDAAAELIATRDLPQTYHRAIRPFVNGKPTTSCPGAALIALLPLEVDTMPSPKDWTAEDWAAFAENTAGNSWGADGYTIPDPVTGQRVHPNTMLRAIRTDTSILRKTSVDLDAADVEAIADQIAADLKTLPDRVVDRIKARL